MSGGSGNWMQTGYESMEHAFDNVPDKTDHKRFWVKENTTKRILFLDNNPSTFWEHQFQFNGDWGNFEPCHVRNKIGPVCHICDAIKTSAKPSYPYFIGLHTVIVMTPHTGQNGIEYAFAREQFAARMGSKEKPGILKKLERIKSKHGRLRGLVIDAYRSGSKTENCGDEFEVIKDESVEATDAAIQALFAKTVPPYLERYNASRVKARKEAVTLEKWNTWNPWVPFDFPNIIKPRSAEALLSMGFGYKSGGSKGGGSGSSESSGSGNRAEDFGDDDIPY